MARLSQTLLLLMALSALALAATRLAGLPLQQVLLLLLGGVLAQGFASWRPAEPSLRGLEKPRRIGQLAAWLLRACIGCAALALMLGSSLTLLPPLLGPLG